MTLREAKSIIKLAIPLVIGQIGQMLLGVSDTVMIGMVGVIDLAALSFVNSLFIIPFVFAIGIFTCVSIRIASARGKNNPHEARIVCQSGFYFALIIGIIFFLISLIAYPFLDSMGQPTDVVNKSRSYYLIMMFSLIPCALSLVLKNHADALNRPWPAFTIFMGGVFFNILLNALLIFGLMGFPKLGIVGAGIATLVARWAIVLAMLIWFRVDSTMDKWTPKYWLIKPNWKQIKLLNSLGLPAGFHTVAEVSTFAAAGLIIGSFGAESIAAHQIALQSSGMAFMIPLGISMALTVRMGEVHGDIIRQKNIVKTGWLMTLFCSLISACLFIFAGRHVAAMFIGVPEIITLAASLLLVSGFFQIVDGIQVASTGLLRGLHDTKTPAKIAIFSYWALGIPGGYYLAHKCGLKAVGVWCGLALGLAVASVFLSIRLWRKV